MSSQLRLKCPGCQVTLQLKGELRGKEVACPKCQKRFRIPAAKPAASDPSPAARPTVAARPVASTAPSTPKPTNEPSLWDDPQLFGGAPSQPDPFAQSSMGSQPQAYSGYYAPMQSSGKSGSSHKKRSDEPLSESDSSTQSTGIFLVVVPILAAILPLFGLQLKRLAGAGEYAPLGAMILGFIGAGLIYYARRNRSDAVIAGMGAAVVTLVFGVGGFLIQRNAVQQAEPVAGQAAPVGKLTPEQIAQQERMVKEMDAQHRQLQQEAEKNHQAMMKQLGSAPDAPDLFPDNTASPGAFGSAPGFSGPDPTMAGPPLGNSSTRGNDLAQEPRIQGALFRIYSSGKDQFFRIGFGDPNRLRTHALVGTTSQQASLFADAPAVSICGFSMGPELNLVPLSTKIDGVKYAIQPGQQEELAGIRFAFDGQAIVGYQGLIRSKTSMQVNDTAWFGRQTSDIRESLNPSPGQYGMICYSNGLACCGFAWVER